MAAPVSLRNVSVGDGKASPWPPQLTRLHRYQFTQSSFRLELLSTEKRPRVLVVAAISGTPGRPARASGKPAQPLSVTVARDDLAGERRRIAQALHDGILQDLTIAGFRLRSLQRSEGTDVKADLGLFAEWLRGRQALLRDFVSSLVTPSSPVEDALTHMRTVLPETCQLIWADDQGQSQETGAFRLGAAMLGVARALVRAGSPTIVEIEMSASDRLRVTHDGRPLRMNTAVAVELRQSLKELGTSLRITQRGDVETVSLAWRPRG